MVGWCGGERVASFRWAPWYRWYNSNTRPRCGPRTVSMMRVVLMLMLVLLPAAVKPASLEEVPVPPYKQFFEEAAAAGGVDLSGAATANGCAEKEGLSRYTKGQSFVALALQITILRKAEPVRDFARRLARKLVAVLIPPEEEEGTEGKSKLASIFGKGNEKISGYGMCQTALVVCVCVCVLCVCERERWVVFMLSCLQMHE